MPTGYCSGPSVLEPEAVDDIRRSLNQSRAYASERFKDKIEAQLKRRIKPGKPGRPRKQHEREEDQTEISIWPLFS
jgi:putative transposase